MQESGMSYGGIQYGPRNPQSREDKLKVLRKALGSQNTYLNEHPLAKVEVALGKTRVRLATPTRPRSV